MITEDYVSYKLAKLLKEKGFYSPYCYTFYYKGIKSKTPSFSAIVITENENKYLAPTHQMVLKWLRETYNIHIIPSYCRNLKNKEFYNVSIYKDIDNIKSYFGKSIFDGFNEYTEAIETAINYCLNKICLEK